MKSSLKSSIAAALLAAASWAPLHANAALFEDDEARRAILDIRARLDAMQAQLNAKADKSNSFDLNNENEQLRQEIAKLRGQIEVLTNQLSTVQKQQKDFYVDLDNRLRKLEPKQVTIDGKVVSIGQAEQRAYDAALAYFKSGDYKNASVAFNDFTHRYPDSALVPSAQYWLGNTFYALRDYRNAIAAQQVVVKNYAENPKAADALLNIASCYIELKDKSAAKNALETLINQYPDSPAAQTAKDRLSSLK